MKPRFVNDLLSALEDRELPLLSWGVTTGVLSLDEVSDTIEGLLAEHNDAPREATIDAVIAYMVSKALLVPVSSTAPSYDATEMPVYRTRMAEALRLTVNLRQLFAPRWGVIPQPGWWLSGPRLVADYRLHVRPRRYPKRDITVDQAGTQLATLAGWGACQERVIRALVEENLLAAFQVDATQRIFSAIGAPRSRGIIVGAGTGSGKTMAFYLPAFASMAGTTRKGIHTLAIYPRVELLRDQLVETIRLAKRLYEAGATSQSIRIGVLYGDTPKDTKDYWQFENKRSAWKRRKNGFVCPYFGCPTCESGELVWLESDRTAGIERLKCGNCSYTIEPSSLALTRKSIGDKPPEILFSTTEMLNRSATGHLAALLGWRGGVPPAVVLLDEVHTYVGMHGAQVALLLRRWRNAARNPITFVGLSATLRDSERFFAALTGLPSSAVDRVEPREADMLDEGREYCIALRGDPISQASLLSTSVQTAMLFGRILDKKQQLFGTTGFAFTDDLDVTNRFYDALRDAEGGQNRAMRSSGQPILAALRSSARDFETDRERDGQVWRVTEKIGRTLSSDLRQEHLRIGRTSSQDAGMDRDADLTVASPSLEVGVNDSRVGLVLQHKAPRNPAAFIQRRGRAGRLRVTRPITVVTLSEFGRDRLAYQAYESLFTPVLTAPTLPVGNRFIQKIQATQAMLDWLGGRMRAQGCYLDPRKVLERPRAGYQFDESTYETVVDILRAVLENREGAQDHLARHIQSALQIGPDDVRAILWDPPRSLLLAVVPTALRRLSTRWESAREDPGARPGDLLPEFLTTSLFAPLSVPEVRLELPFGDQDDFESLGIAQALRETVPGRVSKRYAYRRDDDRTWIAPPIGSDELDLRTMVGPGAIMEGIWEGPDGKKYQVVRPTRISVTEPDPEVHTRSQGTARWVSQVAVNDSTPPHPADVPDPSPWSTRLVEVGFCSHRSGNPIEVRRMTIGADSVIARTNQRVDERRKIAYSLDGRPAALGFHLEVDGIKFVLKQPDLQTPEFKTYLGSSQWRSLAFQDAVRSDSALDDVANKFQREWLAQIYLTAFALAGADGRAGSQVHTELAGGAWRDQLPEILTVMYRSTDTPGSGAPATQRLVQSLAALAAHPAVIDSLNRAGRLLTDSDIVDRTATLATRVYTHTVAAAILAASIRVCPHAQDKDLTVDVFERAQGDHDVVWLTETSIGGVGVVEFLVQNYAQDPRAFWTLVDSILAPGEYEHVDAAMLELLKEVTANPSGTAARAMAELRRARSSLTAGAGLQDLREAWTALSGPPRHAAFAALSTRLLRPGSDAASDRTALRLVEDWITLEERLGVEVDARVMAYVASSGFFANDERKLTADQVFSMLWPRGHQARNQHLHYYQGFGEEAVVDRALISASHAEQLAEIDVDEPDWIARYQAALARHGQLDLVSRGPGNRAVAAALALLPVLPIDRDALRVYGQVRNIVRHSDRTTVRVELREAVQ
ncbi:protein DpdJ [Nocardia wallacei]|uniref:protein DpdJ n=1 Tax=Nocardia wallacei TaxID=480035 RepID=UPI002458D76F|nr:protein DpdJ [Nocardia wallacei]